jgi:hypothetical protein
MMWRVTEVLLREALRSPLVEEPFAVVRGSSGTLLLCKQLVEVPGDPSKATEVIGTLEPPH